MPYINQVAVGKHKELGGFSNDFDTPDGIDVCDYIHVCDLTNAHVCALQAIASNCGIGFHNIAQVKITPFWIWRKPLFEQTTSISHTALSLALLVTLPLVIATLEKLK